MRLLICLTSVALVAWVHFDQSTKAADSTAEAIVLAAIAVAAVLIAHHEITLTRQVEQGDEQGKEVGDATPPAIFDQALERDRDSLQSVLALVANDRPGGSSADTLSSTGTGN